MTRNGEDKGGPARLTIGLPTYNRAKYLREAIDSVLGQTFADFTLVISDNASTDETPEIVASYDDSRIVYRRHETNRGWLANFNVSLEGAVDGLRDVPVR